MKCDGCARTRNVPTARMCRDDIPDSLSPIRLFGSCVSSNPNSARSRNRSRYVFIILDRTQNRARGGGNPQKCSAAHAAWLASKHKTHPEWYHLIKRRHTHERNLVWWELWGRGEKFVKHGGEHSCWLARWELLRDVTHAENISSEPKSAVCAFRSKKQKKNVDLINTVFKDFLYGYRLQHDPNSPRAKRREREKSHH